MRLSREVKRWTSSEPWMTLTRAKEEMNLKISLALCMESQEAALRLETKVEARVSTSRETNSGSSTFNRPTKRA